MSIFYEKSNILSIYLLQILVRFRKYTFFLNGHTPWPTKYTNRDIITVTELGTLPSRWPKTSIYPCIYRLDWGMGSNGNKEIRKIHSICTNRFYTKTNSPLPCTVDRIFPGRGLWFRADCMRCQSDALERRYGQYRHISGGRFLVLLKYVSCSEKNLEN